VRGVTSPSGDNQPLYVIDGVPIGTAGVDKFTSAIGAELTTMTTTNPLSTLAPSDIESIDVLKGRLGHGDLRQPRRERRGDHHHQAGPARPAGADHLQLLDRDVDRRARGRRLERV